MNEILAILTAVINSLWQAAAVAAIVWAALRFWPRTNAATRYAIWWATLAVVLILPAAPRFIATIRHHAVSSAAKSPVNLTPGPAVPNRVELFVIPPAPRRAAQWPIAVLGIWAAILLWRLYQIGRSYLYLRRVKRRAIVSPIPLPNIPRRADLLISSDIASPMALGFRRPAVVLPDSLLEELSDTEREHVLLHEAAHLVRRDDWANLASRFLAGALALHPVAIWILWRIDREREIACDEWVVSRTGAARPYAASLARLFDLLHGRGSQMLASGIFGRGSRIGDRIEALLRRGRTFTTRASTPGIIASAITLAGLMLEGSLAPRWIAFAQAAPRPTFDVASVKRNTSGSDAMTHTGPPDAPGFSAINIDLRTLVEIAYEVKSSQIFGAPRWINSEKFDIAAKAGDTLSRDQSRQMLQSLLVDRFHLALRHETKAIPVYALTGKLRPQKDSVSHCAPEPLVRPASGGTPPIPCGGFVIGPNLIEGGDISMPEFVDVLGNILDRPVVDKTGFTGVFTVRLDFSALGTANNGNSDASRPSIFTALQDQLGLKLEARKSPAEVLVIDHAEKPDAN